MYLKDLEHYFQKQCEYGLNRLLELRCRGNTELSGHKRLQSY